MAQTPPGPARPVSNAPSAPQPKHTLPKFNKNKSNNHTPASSASTHPALSASTSARPTQPPAPTQKRPLPALVKAAVKWADDTALLAINTDYLPAPPRLDTNDHAEICVDVLFGDFEWTREPGMYDYASPYTAYIEIPTREAAMNMLRFRAAKMEDTVEDVEEEGEGEEEEEEDDEMGEGVKEKGKEKGKEKEKEKAVLLYGRKDGTYRATKAFHAKLQRRLKALQTNCDKAWRSFQWACGEKLDSVHASSVVHTICNKLRPPTRELSDMWLSWGYLHWGGLRTFEDFSLCLVAHQRSVSLVMAWLDFLADFLPAGPNGPLLGRARPRPIVRRGVILTGKDIDSMLDWYTRQGIPVHALVHIDDVDIPTDIYRAPSEPRCSRTPSSSLSKEPYFRFNTLCTDLLPRHNQAEDAAQQLVPPATFGLPHPRACGPWLCAASRRRLVQAV